MTPKRGIKSVKKNNKSRNKKVFQSFDTDLSDAFSDEDVSEIEFGAVSKISEQLNALKLQVVKTSPERVPGRLVIAGKLPWGVEHKNCNVKKDGVKIHPNLWTFHRCTDEKYRCIRSGCVSTHNVLITMDHKALTSGNNNFAQLGHSVVEKCKEPALVPGLKDFNIIDAACGRNHTLFLTDEGVVYSCGQNKYGQCGIGQLTDTVNEVTRIVYDKSSIVKVGCGANFSVILNVLGNLYTFGYPEYGQLGLNCDGKHFEASKLTFYCKKTPTIAPLFMDSERKLPVDNVKIVDFACGANHTVAVDSKHRIYSWGFGGYGSLGHGETQNEQVPRMIKFFEYIGIDRVFCGSLFSLALSAEGNLYMFGKKNKSGEVNMRPKLVDGLRDNGVKITDAGCGYTSTVILTTDSTIAWGASPTFGELGLGDDVKSARHPQKVPEMSNMKISQVAMGRSHTLMLVDTDDEETNEKYDLLNILN